MAAAASPPTLKDFLNHLKEERNAAEEYREDLCRMYEDAGNYNYIMPPESPRLIALRKQCEWATSLFSGAKPFIELAMRGDLAGALHRALGAYVNSGLRGLIGDSKPAVRALLSNENSDFSLLTRFLSDDATEPGKEVRAIITVLLKASVFCLPPSPERTHILNGRTLNLIAQLETVRDAFLVRCEARAGAAAAGAKVPDKAGGASGASAASAPLVEGVPVEKAKKAEDAGGASGSSGPVMGVAAPVGGGLEKDAVAAAPTPAMQNPELDATIAGFQAFLQHTIDDLDGTIAINMSYHPHNRADRNGPQIEAVTAQMDWASENTGFIRLAMNGQLANALKGALKKYASGLSGWLGTGSQTEVQDLLSGKKDFSLLTNYLRTKPQKRVTAIITVLLKAAVYPRRDTTPDERKILEGKTPELVAKLESIREAFLALCGVGVGAGAADAKVPDKAGGVGAASSEAVKGVHVPVGSPAERGTVLENDAVADQWAALPSHMAEKGPVAGTPLAGGASGSSEPIMGVEVPVGAPYNDAVAAAARGAAHPSSVPVTAPMPAGTPPVAAAGGGAGVATGSLQPFHVSHCNLPCVGAVAADAARLATVWCDPPPAGARSPQARSAATVPEAAV